MEAQENNQNDYKEEQAKKMEEEKELQDMPLELLLKKQADIKIKYESERVMLEAKISQLEELRKIIRQEVRNVLLDEIDKGIDEKKKKIEEEKKDLVSKLWKENAPIRDELDRRREGKKENVDKEKYLQMIENI